MREQLIKKIGLYPGFVKHNSDEIFNLYKQSKEVDLSQLPTKVKLSATQGTNLNLLKQQLK